MILRELYAIFKQYLNNAINDENRYVVAQKAVLTAESQMRRREKAFKDAEDEFGEWKENWNNLIQRTLAFTKKRITNSGITRYPFANFHPW